MWKVKLQRLARPPPWHQPPGEHKRAERVPWTAASHSGSTFTRSHLNPPGPRANPFRRLFPLLLLRAATNALDYMLLEAQIFGQHHSVCPPQRDGAVTTPPRAHWYGRTRVPSLSLASRHNLHSPGLAPPWLAREDQRGNRIMSLQHAPAIHRTPRNSVTSGFCPCFALALRL